MSTNHAHSPCRQDESQGRPHPPRWSVHLWIFMQGETRASIGGLFLSGMVVHGGLVPPPPVGALCHSQHAHDEKCTSHICRTPFSTASSASTFRPRRWSTGVMPCWESRWEGPLTEPLHETPLCPRHCIPLPHPCQEAHRPPKRPVPVRQRGCAACGHQPAAVGAGAVSPFPGGPPATGRERQQRRRRVRRGWRPVLETENTRAHEAGGASGPAGCRGGEGRRQRATSLGPQGLEGRGAGAT